VFVRCSLVILYLPVRNSGFERIAGTIVVINS